MKEPQRLLDSGTAFERSLLSASHDEAPSRDLDRRVLAAMAGAPLASAATASALARWLSPKSVFAGVVTVGLGAIVVGAMLRREPSHPPPPPALAATATPTATAPPATAAPDLPPSAPVVTPDALPNAPSAPTTAKTATPAPVASASIAREIELLDQVKAKIGAGTPADAALALDAYDQEFPRGSLRPEATVLRIRTLLLAGDRARAEKIGGEFLAQHPNGVHAKRVRALLEEK